MKVIWICNAPVYLADNPKRSTRGGWMEGAMRAINGRVSLVVYYPDNSYHEDEIKNIKYKSSLFLDKNDLYLIFLISSS